MLSFVAPLVALLAKGSTSQTVRAHAVAALNFQIPVSVVGIVLLIIREMLLASSSTAGWALSAFLGLLGFMVVVLGVVFGIVAGIRANESQLYKYPLNLSLIK